MPEARLVKAVTLRVCENGHIVDSGEPVDILQHKSACGHWVWPDANRCHECGERVPAEVTNDR